MKKVFIVSAKRSAIGKFLGSLATVKPGDLQAQVIKQVVADAKLDPAKIDEIFIGHQHSAGQGPSIARRAQLEADIPVEVPATSINMQCGSGMKALILGYNSIQAGANIVLCGGVENMSQVPFILTNKVRNGVKMGNTSVDVQDSLFCDGLIDQFNGYMMGMTAENVVDKIGITRQEQDEFACDSQNKAQKAVESGRFDDEIVPIKYKGKKDAQMVFNRDESYTAGTNLDTLSKLKPAFKKDGSVTAGNASQLNDGAAAIVLASEAAVKENNWQPLAEVIASATVGIDPAIMGLGPVNAVIKTLQLADVKLADIELIELNEAFAAQSLGCIKELARRCEVTEKSLLEKTNVNGGAIALGHPVASSGTRVVVSLLYEMKKTGKKYGLASLCVGGGMGTAMLIKSC